MKVTLERDLQELQIMPPDFEQRYPPLEPGGLDFVFEREREPQFQEFEQLLFRSPTEAGYQLFQARVKEFYESHLASLHLSEETGLPYLLYGDLDDVMSDDYKKEAERFLTTNELLLSGIENETYLAFARTSVWQGITHHVRFAQFNLQGVPVYGANAVFCFQDKKLTAVSSSLFPLLEGDSKFFDSGEFNWPEPQWLHSYILHNLPEEITVSRLLSPPNVNLDRPAVNLGEVATDAWILPYVPPNAKSDSRLEDGWWILPNPLEGKVELRPNPMAGYRPVWRIVIEDKEQRYWLALIDAETEDVLILHETAVYLSTIQYLVYSENPTATSEPTVQSLTLWDGSNLGDVTQPVQFDQTGSVAFTLPDVQDTMAIIDQTPEQMLAANIYFHLYATRDWFEQLFSNFDLHYYLPTVYPPEKVNPLRKLNVKLSNINDAKYDPATHTVEVGKGTGSSILDPGLDRDVLYHEFVHAVVHLLSPEFFQYNGVATNQMNQKRYTESVNEGIAWFFACALSDNPQWADHAYPTQTWQSTFDLSQPPAPVNGTVSIHNSLDFSHNHGLWWARVFQEMSGTTAIEQMTETLLRTVDLLSAPVSSLKMFGVHWYGCTFSVPRRSAYRGDLHQQIQSNLQALNIAIF